MPRLAQLACAVSKMLGHVSFVTTLTVYADYITEGAGKKCAATSADRWRVNCRPNAQAWLVVIFVVAGIAWLSSLNDHIMFGRVSEAGFRPFQAS